MNELFYTLLVVSSFFILFLGLGVLCGDVPGKPIAIGFLIWAVFGFWLICSTVQRNRDKNNQIIVYSEIKESEAGLYYKDALGNSVLIDKNNNFYFADRSKFWIKIKYRKGEWYNGIHFTPKESYAILVENPKAEKGVK